MFLCFGTNAETARHAKWKSLVQLFRDLETKLDAYDAPIIQVDKQSGNHFNKVDRLAVVKWHMILCVKSKLRSAEDGDGVRELRC